MTNFQEVISLSKQILKKYDLCDYCLGRLFSKQLHLSSNYLLGRKIRKTLKSSSTKCYICKNLLLNLKPYVRLMLGTSSDYNYSTILVGAMIKPSIIDRDDYIRSKFKLRGIDSVKTDITKELTKQFVKKTKATVDFLNPDITLTINFKDESCHIRSKSLYFQGRYTKLQRDFPQKQKSCSNCSGKGCRICSYHGIVKFDSVEGKISDYLFSKFGGTTAKFTWIGGEDKSSLVLGSGRPFFVKLQNPTRRKTIIPKTLKINPIQILNLKQIRDYPKKIPKFTSLIEITVSCKSKINPNSLKKLKEMQRSPIVVYEKSGKRSEKFISNLKYKKTSEQEFLLQIEADGGLPVKRFVESDDVSPGISDVMGISCGCKQFDFHEIHLK